NAAVNKLREALSDSVELPRYVETLPRRGYRFIATVETKNASPADAMAAVEPVATAVLSAVTPIADIAAAPALTESVVAPEIQKPRRLLFLAGLLGVSVLIIFVFIGLSWLKHSNYVGEPNTTRVASQRIRPLTNLSDETSDPAFSPDGN